jgi:hypothetical protein
MQEVKLKTSGPLTKKKKNETIDVEVTDRTLEFMNPKKRQTILYLVQYNTYALIHI